MTLAELVAIYREKFPAGAKEKSTASTERIHCNHFLKVFGGKTISQTMTTADIQGYIERRSQERWHGKPIKAQTVKKETETFRQLWNWAVGMGILAGVSPVKGTRHVKGKERPSFKTWEEIERIIARGGVSKEEQAELWECLFLSRQQVAEILADVQHQTGHPFIFPMFVFIAHTGARRSEMLRSRVDDFNLQDKTVVIREKKRDRSKAETFRRVDLSPFLMEVHGRLVCQPSGRDVHLLHPPGETADLADGNKDFSPGIEGEQVTSKVIYRGAKTL